MGLTTGEEKMLFLEEGDVAELGDNGGDRRCRSDFDVELRPSSEKLPV